MRNVSYRPSLSITSLAVWILSSPEVLRAVEMQPYLCNWYFLCSLLHVGLIALLSCRPTLICSSYIRVSLTLICSGNAWTGGNASSLTPALWLHLATTSTLLQLLPPAAMSTHLCPPRTVVCGIYTTSASSTCLSLYPYLSRRRRPRTTP